MRLTDLDSQNGFAGSGEGADIDAVIALHGRPAPASVQDADGDGLSDQEELRRYATDPADPDSDGDGVDDGREVAGCRDPGSAATTPWFHDEPRLWVVDVGPCDELRWSFAGSGVSYDLVRGELGQLGMNGLDVDLGVVDCLDGGSVSLRWSCDAEIPPVGEGRFYAVRPAGASSYGSSSSLDPRTAPASCP